jgi:uncharacterized protein DUF5335
MRTVDVPAQDWSRTLDEFSANHEGALVSLELLASALGAQLEVRDLPLLGITVETGARDSTITITVARSNEEHTTHVIHSPTAVRLERTNDEADVALQIESAEGTTALLRLRP